MSSQPRGSAGWGAWVAFVAVMMILIGVFSMLAGLAALLDDGFITSGLGSGEIFILSTKSVGVFWLIIGALLIWAGGSLILGKSWARAVTVLLVGVHAVIDLLTITVHPFLSLLFIFIAVTVIYGLTVKWEEAKIGMGD